MLKNTKVDVLFSELLCAQENMNHELQKQGLLSDLSDDWFVKNVIKSINPTELARVLAEVDPRFENRDDILKSVLKIWLVMGKQTSERSEYVRETLSSLLPSSIVKQNKHEKDQNRKSGTFFGLTQSQLARVEPEVARMSFLAGRTQKQSMRSKRIVNKGMQKRRNEIDYTIILLRALHCFIVDVGGDKLDIVAREAILTAVYGLKAKEDGTIENEQVLKETRIRTHNQNMTVAARAIAERKTVGDLS
jgi:hypothetical protein